MNDSIDLISFPSFMLDDQSIQNIITAIELSNLHGRNGRPMSSLYCTLTRDSKNNNSLGIHVAFKDQDKVDPCS